MPWMKVICAAVLGILAGGGGACFGQGDPARSFDPQTAAARKPGTIVRVDLIGDSTQTDNAGYGRGFCANLTAKVDCVNMAKGGASTRTYREQGLWDRALETKPDYMVIQFGHNDMVTGDHLARQVPLAGYVQNLEAIRYRSTRSRNYAGARDAADAQVFRERRQDSLRSNRVQ